MSNETDYLMDKENESSLYLLGNAMRSLNTAVFVLYKNAFNKYLEFPIIQQMGIMATNGINELFFNLIDEFFDDETKEYLKNYLETERNIIELKIEAMQ